MNSNNLYIRYLIVSMLALSALLLSCAPGSQGGNTAAPAAEESQPAAFQSESIIFHTYRNLGDNVNTDIGLAIAKYDCGIVGMATLGGDIHEDDAGNILQIYMYRNNETSTWWIRADFRTEDQHENWTIHTMCIDKRKAEPGAYFLTDFVTESKFSNLGDNVDQDTTISTDAYYCGIVGMAALDGDINEDDTGDIIRTFTYRNNGTWWLRADFHTHDDHENWNINLLCVERDSSIFHYEEFPEHGDNTQEFTGLGDNVVYDTDIQTRDYICGIVGMAAFDGDIDEGADDGQMNDIIAVFMHPGPVGNWTIRADFNTEDDNEDWNINVLCASTAVAVIGDIAITEPTSQPATCPTDLTKLNTYPEDRENGWSKELNGVADDDKENWFFTQAPKDPNIGVLWKFPITHNLNNSVPAPDRQQGILRVFSQEIPDLPKCVNIE